MASADFLRFVVTMLRFEFVYSFAPARPPRGSVTTFTSYICCIYTLKFGQYRTLFWLANSSPFQVCLIYSSCSSDQGFAFGFLLPPPHDGRPCPLLTVPTAMPVVDFHLHAVSHAERTNKKAVPSAESTAFIILVMPKRRGRLRTRCRLPFQTAPKDPQR